MRVRGGVSVLRGGPRVRTARRGGAAAAQLGEGSLAVLVRLSISRQKPARMA
jgi:hypothetical protein